MASVGWSVERRDVRIMCKIGLQNNLDRVRYYHAENFVIHILRYSLFVELISLQLNHNKKSNLKEFENLGIFFIFFYIP